MYFYTYHNLFKMKHILKNKYLLNKIHIKFNIHLNKIRVKLKLLNQISCECFDLDSILKDLRINTLRVEEYENFVSFPKAKILNLNSVFKILLLLEYVEPFFFSSSFFLRLC